MTNTKTPDDSKSNISWVLVTLGGFLFALSIVGLLLVKDRIPLPIARFLGLGDAYPTQGLIGPQKFIHGWESASRPSPSEGEEQHGE